MEAVIVAVIASSLFCSLYTIILPALEQFVERRNLNSTEVSQPDAAIVPPLSDQHQAVLHRLARLIERLSTIECMQ